MKSLRSTCLALAATLPACVSLPPDMTTPLHGVVLDQSTHRPVAGAAVRIKEFPDVFTLTAADGTFSLAPRRRWQAPPSWNTMPAYRIAVDAPGYSLRVVSWDTGDWHAQVLTLRSSAAADSIED